MGERAGVTQEKGRNPEEIRGEIEHTRAELTETVKALKGKLSTERNDSSK